ncbi:ribosome recycling factor [Puniceicoccus vermicola]
METRATLLGMDTDTIQKKQVAETQKALEHTLAEFNSLHTGKASPAMVEGIVIEVSSYGSSMPLRDIAAITTPDARTIQIQPWDKTVIKDVEKALQKANLGINPVVDGALVRLNIPELSKERRQELVKVAHKHAEDGRISVRQARRNAMDALKIAEKEESLSEDDVKRVEKEIQKTTDDFVEKINEAVTHKEKELLRV